jgi:hypothetical protein
VGLFSHLFGSKTAIAKELVKDDKKRMALWKEHLTNHTEREKLCAYFNGETAKELLTDFEVTDKILKKLEALISAELVNIADEEKTDEEILEDLEKLRSVDENENLFYTIGSLRPRLDNILKLFREILKVLKAELHLIKLIRKKAMEEPKEAERFLHKLFKLIFHNENRLYRAFREHHFHKEDRHIHEDIKRIARGVILQEELEKERETDDEKFVREIIKQMDKQHYHQYGPKQEYRELGEDIFDELIKLSKELLEGKDDIIQGLEHIENLIKEDIIMYKIIKKLKPKYDNAKIKLTISAFRRSYNLAHFIDLHERFF